MYPNSHCHRYRYIDMLKGFSMLLVIADHSGFTLCPVLDYLEVPVFFLASGFLFSLTPFAVFLRKKALRIVVPYLMYDFLYILMCVLIGHEPLSVKSFVSMMLAPANYPLWFLRSLFWSLLMMWLICRVDRRGGGTVPMLSHLLVLIITMVIGNVVYYFCHDNELQLITGLPQAVAAMPLLIVGYWLRPWLADISLRQQRSKLATAGVLLMLAAVALVHGHIAIHVCNIGEKPWLFYPMSLLSCLAFLVLFMTIDAHMPSSVARVAKEPSAVYTFCLLPFTFLMFVGRQSLLYFCLHAIVIYTLCVYGVATPWHVLIATVAITTVLVYLLHSMPALRKIGLA